MALFTQFSFPAHGVRSHCWRGDELVDWVGGGRAFSLDGTTQAGNVHYAYARCFNAHCAALLVASAPFFPPQQRVGADLLK
jgi:hypothetical protein